MVSSMKMGTLSVLITTEFPESSALIDTQEMVGYMNVYSR